MAGDVTTLLARWGDGDRGALDELMPLVYGELRQNAGAYLRRERADHTLQPTALVHEAWLRLVRQGQPAFDHRRQFYALAAQVMRRILIDHARATRADKRGGGQVRVACSSDIGVDAPGFEDLLSLDSALARLAAVNARQAQVIELRYFGGLNVEEAADVLGISPATVSRDQRVAEAWLGQAMADDQQD